MIFEGAADVAATCQNSDAHHPIRDTDIPIRTLFMLLNYPLDCTDVAVRGGEGGHKY
jgi:hypothetical protein